MSDPVKTDVRADGIVVWRFTDGEGTVEVEAASKADAVAKYQAYLDVKALPPAPSPLAAIAKLDPKTATVADVILAAQG